MGRSPGWNWIWIFSLKIWHLVAPNLKIFLITKSPNFLQNFQILCWIWKQLNSAKHWIAIVSKTVTGQYGSSAVLQQVNDQSYHQCKFLGVHTALCGVVEHWQQGAWSQNWGSIRGLLESVKYHCLQCKRQFARNGQISKFHIFAPRNAAPAECRPGRMPPSPPRPAATASSLLSLH